MAVTKEQKRQRCLESIFWTGWYLCGYRKLSMVLHLAMTLWLEKAWAELRQWALVMVPRDYFKTSALGVAHVVNYLLNHPDGEVLYMMHKYGKAAEKMDEVQKAFESKAMAHLFPEYAVTAENMSSLKWTSGAFTIPRPSGTRGSPSVECAGIVTGTVGSHYDLIILDDIIKGDSDQAAAQLEAGTKFMQTVIFLFKDKRSSRLLVLGTLWEGGFYEPLMESPDFARLILGCLVDDRFEQLLAEVGVTPPRDKDDPYVQDSVMKSNWDKLWQTGHAIFPEMEDDQTIAMAKRLSKTQFNTQMLNIPSGADSKRFRREDFVEYQLRYKANHRPAYCEVDGVKLAYAWMVRTLTWDPTGGESKDCDTAGISVCGWERTAEKAFLFDYRHEQMDIITQINTVLDLAVRWDVKVISPEWVAFQVTLKRFLEEEMKRRLADGRMMKRIRIEPYRRGAKSKGTWILDSLTPFVAEQQLHILPEHGEVIDHLVGLTIRNGIVLGASPGLADSLAMHQPWWKRRSAATRPLDEIRDETSATPFARPPTAYGLTPSAWQGGMAV